MFQVKLGLQGYNNIKLNFFSQLSDFLMNNCLVQKSFRLYFKQNFWIVVTWLAIFKYGFFTVYSFGIN